VFEPKWDGFRCLARPGPRLRAPEPPRLEHDAARRRAPWDPAGVYDGELVALQDGTPYFPDLCSRLLNGDRSIPLTFIVFEVLQHRRRWLLDKPYRERRALLARLDLSGEHWQLTPVFENGGALVETVREHELEGVVAKKLDGRYRPGEREWIKVKNRAYWRYELERESAIRARIHTRV
jgi:bifunctional non-homologous end joining protein LigD